VPKNVGAFKLPVPHWQQPFPVAGRQARLFFGEFDFKLEPKIGVRTGFTHRKIQAPPANRFANSRPPATEFEILSQVASRPADEVDR
jgi:hypothetical protein